MPALGVVQLGNRPTGYAFWGRFTPIGQPYFNLFIGRTDSSIGA